MITLSETLVVESRGNDLRHPSIPPVEREVRDLVAPRAIAEIRARDIEIDALPEIDLSIVTYQSHEVLEPFFESLLSQDYPLSKVHLLICQHSENIEDETRILQFVGINRGRFKRISHVHASNGGFGAGHNTNFRAAKTDYFLVSNVDLRFERDTLPILVHTAKYASPDVACFEARQSPLEHPKFYNPATLETSWCSGCALLIRAPAFKDVRGFDESFFMYGEDVDLSVRLRAKGYHLLYCPWAVVNHLVGSGRSETLTATASLKVALILNWLYGSWIGFGSVLGGVLYLAFWHDVPERRRSASRALREWFLWLRKLKTRKRGPLSERWRAKTLFRRMNNRFEYEWRRPFVLSIPKAGSLETYEPPVEPLVSIIMRYSGGRKNLFEHALRSACFQTASRIQIVVVEDGVSEVGRLVEIYHAAGFNISHVSLDKAGRATTASVGISAALGRYLCFLDDDDFLFLDHVETLLRAIRVSAVDAAASWATCSSARSDWWTGLRDVSMKLPPWYANEYNDDNLAGVNYFPIQSVLFSRADAVRAGRVNGDLDLLEDWDFFARLLHRKKVRIVPQTTSVFRVPHSRLKQHLRNRRMVAPYHEIRGKIAAVRSATGPTPRRTIRLVYHHIGETTFDPAGMFVSETNFRDQLAVIEDRKRVGLLGHEENQIGIELHFDDAYGEIFDLFDSFPTIETTPCSIFVPTGAIEAPSTLITEVVRAVLAEGGEDVGRLARLLQTFDPQSAALNVRDLYFATARFLKSGARDAVSAMTEQIVKIFASVIDRRVRTMSRDQLGVLARAGVALGGHGHTHRSLTALTGQEVDDELQKCQMMLRDIIGKPAASFAFPYGAEDDVSAEAVAHVTLNGFHSLFWSRETAWQNGETGVQGRFQVGNLDCIRFAHQLDAIIGLFNRQIDPPAQQIRYQLARTPLFVRNVHLRDLRQGLKQ